MTSLTRKLWVGGLVLAGAVAYLAYAGLKQGWVYYVSVDQFKTDVTAQKTRVRLMGKVCEEKLAINSAGRSASFQLAGLNPSNLVSVYYKGNIPDLFKANVDVVVEGRLDPSGTFQADVLMTKCASKYENKHPDTNTKPATAPVTVSAINLEKPQ